jgi:hypothetical protein
MAIAVAPQSERDRVSALLWQKYKREPTYIEILRACNKVTPRKDELVELVEKVLIYIHAKEGKVNGLNAIRSEDEEKLPLMLKDDVKRIVKKTKKTS